MWMRNLLTLNGQQAVIGLALIVFAFLFVRCYIAQRESLWQDELWSLSIATGHVLIKPKECPPAVTDYTDTSQPMPVSYFNQYLSFDSRCKLPASIFRTCSLGDWNPPLYFLLLCLWCKIGGISDFNIRLPSIAFSLITLPFIWLIGQRLSGKSAALLSTLLFAFAPISLFYSTEARAYALVILLSSILLWLTLYLSAPTSRWRRAAAIAWSIVGGFGLLSSFTFVAIFIPCLLWLFFRCPSLPSRRIFLVLLGSCAMALFWYIRLPEILSTRTMATDSYAGWMPWWLAATRPINYLLAYFAGFGTDITLYAEELPGLFFSMLLLPMIPVFLPIFKSQARNILSVRLISIAVFLSGICSLILHITMLPAQIQATALIVIMAGTIIAFATVWIYARKKNYGIFENFDARLQLLYVTVLFALLLPTVLDLVKHTHMALRDRYSLVGLPAAFVLGGMALSKCRMPQRLLLIAITICLWMPLYVRYTQDESRRQENYKGIGSLLSKAKDSEVIMVYHCGGVCLLGVVRYLPVAKNIIGWCDLDQTRKLPDDMLSIIKGKTGLYFVDIGPDIPQKDHPANDWLRQNARLEKTWSFPAQVLYFVPKQGKVF